VHASTEPELGPPLVQTRIFTLTERPEGYRIGDVSP
jgi:hypothetical protein